MIFIKVQWVRNLGWEHVAKWTLDSLIKRCRGQFPLLVMCRKGGHTFHSILLLPTHPAVMGIWWTRIVSEWLKLLAYLYYVCVVTMILPGEMRWLKWCVSCAREGNVSWIWYRYQTLNYVPLPLSLISIKEAQCGLLPSTRKLIIESFKATSWRMYSNRKC